MPIMSLNYRGSVTFAPHTARPLILKLAYTKYGIELHPAVSLLPETKSLPVAAVELQAGALSRHLELQHYKILFICGRSSSRLDRNTFLEVRRANPSSSTRPFWRRTTTAFSWNTTRCSTRMPEKCWST